MPEEKLQKHSITHLTKSSDTLNKISRVQKGEVNQKQQLSDYSYITIHATKSFDIC